MNPFHEGFPVTPELLLPADADARRMAFVGMSGSGKTSDAKVIVEHLARAGRRVAILDPNGIWHGIKTSSDGSGPGLPFIIFGGRHGDVPLEVGMGAAVADLVMDDGLPVVLDLSGFENDADGLRVVADFIKRLRFRQNADYEPILLVVDEADLIAPQSARKEEMESQRMLINVAKRSRADGLGLLVITQRPVGLATSILNQMEAVFLLRFAGYNDLERVNDWIGAYLSKSERDQVIAALPSLSEGECFVSSPAWMRTFQRVQFPLPDTYDSSATPRAGSGRRSIVARADVDLSALAQRFAQAIQDEQENDPQVLKARVAELQKQLEQKNLDQKPIQAVEKIVEVEKIVRVSVLEDGHVEQLRAIADTLTAGAKDMVSMAQEILVRVGAVQRQDTPQTFPDVQTFPDSFPPPILGEQADDWTHKDSESAENLPKTTTPKPETLKNTPKPPPPIMGVSRPQQAILDTLADLAALGLGQPRRDHVALFAGTSPKSSAYTNNLGALRTAGLIDYPAPRLLCLTDQGRGAARSSGRPLTQQAIQQAWLSRLTKPQRRIVEALLRCHPNGLGKGVLADWAGASATSSAYTNNLGALRSLGLLHYPTSGMVALTDLLFPKGLPAK